MQTILGASGQIGTELARALARNHTQDIRLVSRSPEPVNPTDTLLSANLLDPAQTAKAVKGSEIVYLTAGLPMDTARWKREWQVIMQNVIRACEQHCARLVYFDNTYMYPQTATPADEATAFKPDGSKGKVRAECAKQLLEAIQAGRIEGMICRAPEFYGPGKTQSITKVTILNKLRSGEKASVFLRDDTKRTLIFTPDASRAMAVLGNTSDAYQQTWHLPCDDNRMTYKQLIDLAGDILGQRCEYRIIRQWQLFVVAAFSREIRGSLELLPRYQCDNIFVSDKFKQRFPDFIITPYRQGLQSILLSQTE